MLVDCDAVVIGNVGLPLCGYASDLQWSERPK